MDMPNEKMDMIFLIDRSGSMCGSETDTIGGFNSYLKRGKEENSKTRITTILFDHEYEVLYTRKPIGEVSELTEKEYYVRGSTALLDAVGRTINTLDKEIDNNVLFVIITDGYENSSKEYSKSQIKNLIENHNWEFIFLGADIDSFSEANGIGIRKTRVANYKKSRDGLEEVFCSISDAEYAMKKKQSLDDSNWRSRLDKYD